MSVFVCTLCTGWVRSIGAVNSNTQYKAALLLLPHHTCLYIQGLAEKFIWWQHMLVSFLTNEIQALQHQWKKCVDRKGDYVEKYTSFSHIPWEYLGQPMNFSAKPCISISIIRKCLSCLYKWPVWSRGKIFGMNYLSDREEDFESQQFFALPCRR